MIPFNKPYYTGRELEYIKQVTSSGKSSGNGPFTQKCQEWLEKQYGFAKVLLTPSCTDALELAALLIDIKPDDEVIIPSYTFVSTANPFLLRGAKVIFADSTAENPNIDPEQISSLITSKTKAIVVVHYAGISCDMDAIVSIAKERNLYLIEDAAQCIGANHKGAPLGGIGDIGAFSFHDTKNIIAGEGGCIIINNKELEERAEILWEKGTNRAAFFRGEIDKYGWVDVGSSFLASEFTAAILYSQLEELEIIQAKRKKLWDRYFEGLKKLSKKGLKLPYFDQKDNHNAHMFYLVCNNENERTQLIQHLNQKEIKSVFHYLSLHCSEYFIDRHDGRRLLHADDYTNCLIRLPMYYELELVQVDQIVEAVLEFYHG